MEIIPVIDIKDGQAVHAIKGERSAYRPLKTPLCPSSRPVDVITRFTELGNFKKIYIADLNSIMRQGDNDELIRRLTELFPNLVFWIDNGFRQAPATSSPMSNHVPVIGSESLDANQMESLENLNIPFVLSLDFSSEGKLGPDRLFMGDRYWPRCIVIMTLGKVGSETGPDFQKLKYYRNRYPDKTFIAAGGIRGLEDLLELSELGIRSALVATALHSKSISNADINNLRKQQERV